MSSHYTDFELQLLIARQKILATKIAEVARYKQLDRDGRMNGSARQIQMANGVICEMTAYTTHDPKWNPYGYIEDVAIANNKLDHKIVELRLQTKEEVNNMQIEEQRNGYASQKSLDAIRHAASLVRYFEQKQGMYMNEQGEDDLLMSKRGQVESVLNLYYLILQIKQLQNDLILEESDDRKRLIQSNKESCELAYYLANEADNFWSLSELKVVNAYFVNRTRQHTINLSC